MCAIYYKPSFQRNWAENPNPSNNSQIMITTEIQGGILPHTWMNKTMKGTDQKKILELPMAIFNISI